MPIIGKDQIKMADFCRLFVSWWYLMVSSTVLHCTCYCNTTTRKDQILQIILESFLSQYNISLRSREMESVFDFDFILVFSLNDKSPISSYRLSFVSKPKIILYEVFIRFDRKDCDIWAAIQVYKNCYKCEIGFS